LSSNPQITPNWDELLSDAASGQPHLMHASAQRAYAAWDWHFSQLGFPSPKAYQYRDSMLKAAASGHVPGPLIDDYSKAIYYLRDATHGAKGLDLNKGVATIKTLRTLWDITTPCQEASQHLVPSPDTRKVITEALQILGTSDEKLLAHHHVTAVNALEHLRRHVGKDDNWNAIVKAASSRFISGALAMQLFFASRDRAAPKRNNRKGWEMPTNEALTYGIRAMGTLFGMEPEFLWLPNGGWKIRSTLAQSDQACEPTIGDSSILTSRDLPDISQPRSGPSTAAVDTQRSGGYWVILESTDGRPYYQHYDKSGPITRTELRGSADLEVVKALPSVVFDVEFANGIPYLRAVANAIDIVIDGVLLRNGERREITDALAQLKVGNLPPLRTRRVWHVPK
jgi:hypothetical protein